MIKYGFASLLFAILLTACGKVPQAEIDLAYAVIDSARTAGAEVYLPDEFSALTDSLNSALVLSEGQGSKMIKNYGEVKDKLSVITEQARELKIKTEARKEELTTQINETIAGIKTLLEENKQLIAQAPKGKEGTAALVAIKSDLSVIEATIAEVEMMMGEGDLLSCHDKASAAMQEAMSINDELTEVIAKYNKARK